MTDFFSFDTRRSYHRATLCFGLCSVLFVLGGCHQSSASDGDQVNNGATPSSNEHNNQQSLSAQSIGKPVGCNNQAILQAYVAQRLGTQVYGCGTVIKLLPTDNKGRRHQKLIVRLAPPLSGHTVLIAHNIDLAPKAEVDVGDKVAFYGEYAYNKQGGVVHWTHHDPAQRHQNGWIERLSGIMQRYQ